MKKVLYLWLFAIGLFGSVNAQVTNQNQAAGTNALQQTKTQMEPAKTSAKSLKINATQGTAYGSHHQERKLQPTSSTVNPKIPLSENGKLLSPDGFEVDFVLPSNPEVSSVCGTRRPYVNASEEAKSASCPFSVPCDDPANRDAALTSLKYFQLEWHVMWNGSGASSNITQATIDALMAELNADYASHNMVFCANPANFYTDVANYDHDMNTEEFSLKAAYVTNPTNVINIYVVGSMTAGGYARFPTDPNGGTSPNGGIVLNRGNCWVGSHTLAHEMGHTFGLAHTFAGVDEEAECSSCYERVRNANGSSNTSGVGTPFGGPYNTEGDKEGDWCSDTNPHDTYAYNCSTSNNSNGACDAGPWANAPVNNHMSYSFCSSQFTDQQSRRMHCMINTYLGSWTAYGGGVCGSQPPVADFTGTPTSWQATNNVTFTDLSAPTSIINTWTWTFDVAATGTVSCTGCTGANATYVGQNPPVVAYSTPGQYTVSLTVDGPNGSDTETKTNYINVTTPAGDCDTLDLYWINPTPSPTFIGGLAAGESILLTPDPSNSPTFGIKGAYEQYITPTPGVTQVGGVRVGLGMLGDANDNMVFQIAVYDDDGTGLPGALLGGSGTYSPTDLGVPAGLSYAEYWLPFTAVTPTTSTFHIGIEVFPGDLTDSLRVLTSSSATAQGQGNGLNHIWSEDWGYENLLGIYGVDVDLDIIPVLGGSAPYPLVQYFEESYVCDTTYVTIHDTVLYSIPNSWSVTFADGTVINSSTDPQTIDRVYTTPGPDTVTYTVINDCGRADTTTWIIPYTFTSTPSAEFATSTSMPVCIGDAVAFAATNTNYLDYTWAFGDGNVVSSGTSSSTNHSYTAAGTYYVELNATAPGPILADTFYLETFEGGWPAGYTRYDVDPYTPDAGVNPPFDGTDATAWLVLDVDGNGDGEAVSTSWNASAGQLADDWMITSAIGPLPANQRLYWDAEALDAQFPDGYEVRLSTSAAPATTANFSTLLFSTTGENAFNTTRNVDLSGYVGQNVYIAFRNNSDWMYLLSIDNIRVGTGVAGCDASLTKWDYVDVQDCSVTPPTAAINSTGTAGCAPYTVTFTDGTTVGDPATTWLWSFNDGTFSTVQNPTAHTFTNPGTYNVTLETCNDGGCTTTSMTITVHANPSAPTITATGPTTFCAGSDVDLQSSYPSGNTWSTTETGSTITVNSTGSYTVTYMDGNGCSATSAPFAVTAVPLPTIASGTVTNPNACATATGSIQVTGSGTGNISWSGTASGGPTAVTLPYTIPNLTAGSYNITFTDGTGCTSNTLNQSLTDPTPPVTPTITPSGPTTFCNGGSVTLSSSYATGNSWSNSATTQDIIVTTSGTYSVTYTDASSCSASSAAVVVTVNNNPSVPTISASGPTTICAGQSVTLTSSQGTGNTWSTTETTPSIVVSGAGSYTVTFTNANGCSSTSAPTVVSVNPLPTAPTISAGGPTTFCDGGSVVLTSSQATGNTWSNTSTSPSITVSTGGTYTVTYTDGNGCSNTSASEVVTVNSLPSVSFSALSNTCENYAPFALSGGTPAGGTYSGTGVSGGQFDPSVGTGTYTITYSYTDANTCTNTATSDITVDACLAVDNISSDELQVYPNPFGSVLTVKLDGKFNYELFDASGRLILKGDGNNESSINTQVLEAGYYVLRISGSLDEYNVRLTKTN